MKFNLKKVLKQIKLNEENISMVLGAIVIVIVGVLVVNYFKDRDNGKLSNGALQTVATNEHTVTKGESLWSIAEDSYGSGYNWVDIKSANNLESEILEVGQKLTIPEVSAKQPTSTSKIAKITTSQVSAISGESYTVVSGDNLWNIAVRAYGDGFKWTEIAKVNKLVNPNLIHPGNILTLPR